jgi:hypothetical protein
MPAWVLATVGFAAYVVACAVLVSRLRWRTRLAAATTAAAAAACALASLFTGSFVLRSLLLPVGSLVLGYRSTGFLWRAPDARAESILISVDLALRIAPLAARAPRAIAEYLELAYAAVYPLIPVALYLHLRLAPVPDADWFWAVILVTDYVCFAMLPWIQTRPPRAIEQEPPWRASTRRVNLGILHNVSIQMNTVPSGHAAEALACALVLTGGPQTAVAAMFFIALSVSAGALFGRYHYTVDIVLGWAVALVVWWLLRV